MISNEFAGTKSYKNRAHLYRFWRTQGMEPGTYEVVKNTENRFYAIFPEQPEIVIEPEPEVVVEPEAEAVIEPEAVIKPEPKIAPKATYITISSIEKPCEAVRRIANEMYAADSTVTRMQIINACIEAGVATGTARKQYNDWRKKRGL